MMKEGVGAGRDCIFSVSLNFPRWPRNPFKVELNQMLHNTWSNTQLFCSVNSALFLPGTMRPLELLALLSFSMILTHKMGAIAVPSSQGWCHGSLSQRIEQCLLHVGQAHGVCTLFLLFPCTPHHLHHETNVEHEGRGQSFWWHVLLDWIWSYCGIQ